MITPTTTPGSATAYRLAKNLIFTIDVYGKTFFSHILKHNLKTTVDFIIKLCESININILKQTNWGSSPQKKMLQAKESDFHCEKP